MFNKLYVKTFCCEIYKNSLKYFLDNGLLSDLRADFQMYR